MQRFYSPLVCLSAFLVFASPRSPGHVQATPGMPADVFGPSTVAASAGPPRWKTEQEWIVADIADAIVNMAGYATGSRSLVGPPTVTVLPGANEILARFRLTVPSYEPADIDIRDHIWAPRNYAALAARALGATDGPRCKPDSTSLAVAALLNPRADVILRENTRISGRLQGDMRCAGAHHEAALLVGAFALREAAGAFSDPRRLMSRMTAHLALADAAGESESATVRRLADAVLLTLAGRQQTALDRLAAIESSSPDADVQAWIRALRLRNTFDWRTLTQPPRATPLEQLSLLRALEISMGDAPSLELLDSIDDPEEAPDWARIVLQDNNASVEGGNRFDDFWIEAELQQAFAVFHTMHGTSVLKGRDAIVPELNAESAAGPVTPAGPIQVLDWGTWAAAAQRHLSMALIARDTHLNNSLGLPEEAKAFRAESDRRFGGLRLYPFVAMTNASTQAEWRPALAAAATLVRARPELATDWLWKCLLKKASGTPLPEPVPGNAEWFAPFFLPGTAYDMDHRPNSASSVPRFNSIQIAEIRRRAPYSRVLVHEVARSKGGDKPPYAVLRQEYEALASYDLGLARGLAIAAWDDPDTYIAQMELVCRLNPDGFWDLAPYLADHGRIEDARRAYERWLETGRSQVAIANSMEWLVRHYFERGEQAKATAVADRAADVYSYWGLVTRANLHDWRGEQRQAEQVYRAAWKRYDNPNELLAFYLRHGRKGAEVDALMAKVFPAGMQRIVGPSPGQPPVDGIRLVTTGIVGREHGLRAGDVVVGVDGIRVGNIPQYRVARGASGDAMMRFTIWRGGRYIDVPARLRHGWVVSSIADYDPRTATQ